MGCRYLNYICNCIEYEGCCLNELKEPVSSLLQKARSHIQDKAFKEAQKLYLQILEEAPDNLEALCNMGVVLKLQNRLEEALEQYTKAISNDGTYILAYMNRANLLRSLKHLKEAKEDYVSVLNLEPKNADALNSLGSVYETEGEVQKAFDFYQRAIAADSSFYKAYNNCAVALYSQGKYPEAISYFEQTIKLNPSYVEAYSNLGAVFAKLNAYTKAVSFYQKAIELNPSYAGAYTNLGNALNKLGEYEQAVYFHLRAIKLDPRASNHYANLGSAYKNIGRFDRAKQMYQKAIELEPNHVNAHFDLSTVLLQTGEYEQGWKEYEWRFKKEQMLGHIKTYEAIFSKPLYTDQDIKGKTILIHAEQGFGDSLMMIRYVHVLKQRGAKIVLYLREGLEELFKSIDGIDMIQTRGEKPADFDYHLPLMSLAYRCDPHLHRISEVYPYLDTDKRNMGLQENKKFKIGIVWGASNTGESYKKKVFSIEHFLPLLDKENIQLYSLQLGEDAKALKEEPYKSFIQDLSVEIQDFSDTAALLKELDLIISSDTSLAHLAGAMGLNVWVLLQKVPDWRWGVSGKESLWYPSARLFWQDSLGDWTGVFNQVFKSLQKEYNL